MAFSTSSKTVFWEAKVYGTIKQQSTEDFKQTTKHTISLFHIILLQFYFLTICWRVFISFLGLWAVVNTADVCLKGRIEMQESAQWETLFKTNVFGTLKAARTFYPLLVSQKGKQILFKQELFYILWYTSYFF